MCVKITINVTNKFKHSKNLSLNNHDIFNFQVLSFTTSRLLFFGSRQNKDFFILLSRSQLLLLGSKKHSRLLEVCIKTYELAIWKFTKARSEVASGNIFFTFTTKAVAAIRMDYRCNISLHSRCELEDG